MSPSDASVYSDTLSATTWVLLLTAMVVFVMALMVALIALVHRSCEITGVRDPDDVRATDAPTRLPAQAGPGAGTVREAAPAAGEPHLTGSGSRR
jgi:hypothetical protein